MIGFDILLLERCRALGKLICEWLRLEFQSFLTVDFTYEVIQAFFRRAQSLSPQLLSYKNVHLTVLAHLRRGPPLLGLQGSLALPYPNRFLP